MWELKEDLIDYAMNWNIWFSILYNNENIQVLKSPKYNKEKSPYYEVGGAQSPPMLNLW